MAIEILMPALSPTMEEGKLAKWMVKVGDRVKSGQIIAEIETDKATMEVEAVDEGEVIELLVSEGADGVKVNAIIARLAEDGDDKALAAAANATKSKTAPVSSSAKPESSQPAVSASAASTPKAAPDMVPTARSGSNNAGGRIFASPLAKRIASQMGIDLSGIVGSGPNGRIVRQDLEHQKPGASRSLAVQNPQNVPTNAPVSRPARSLVDLGYDAERYTLRPIDNMRKTIARRLTDSFRDVPHFPLNVDVEIDALLRLRKDLNATLEKEGVKVSVNDFVIRACALSLQRVPESNASFTPEGIALHRHADVAVAVAIEGGLITPIIMEAELKSVRQISVEMIDLAARARARRLKPHEFQGGTFSLSNLGMMGIKSFASILNEPQGCILSVGAGEERPVARNGVLAVAQVMSVTLTCDHRVVDGAIGAAFLKEFKTLIEQPLSLLA